MAEEIELSKQKTTTTDNDIVNKDDDTFKNMSNQIQENPLHKKSSKEKTRISQEEEDQQEQEGTPTKKKRKRRNRGVSYTQPLQTVKKKMTCCNIIGCRGLIILLLILSVAILHFIVAMVSTRTFK